ILSHTKALLKRISEVLFLRSGRYPKDTFLNHSFFRDVALFTYKQKIYPLFLVENEIHNNRKIHTLKKKSPLLKEGISF
ncbi:hypothetical protein, partial [Shimazuella alba]|uniref:hypothetical protein n=1 Tax=Shimazuella alba TaxID=2690964 RepID=UPI001F19FE10